MLSSILVIIWCITFVHASMLQQRGTLRGRRVAGFDTLLLDCDGTICDTELVTLAAFNDAFREKQINAYWDIDIYTELLKVGASRERITHYFDNYKKCWPGFEEGDFVPTDIKHQVASSLQALKNECFQKAYGTATFIFLV